MWELIFFDTSLHSSQTVGLLCQAWAWSEASLFFFRIGCTYSQIPIIRSYFPLGVASQVCCLDWFLLHLNLSSYESVLVTIRLRLLRTNSSKLIFEEKITNFKAHLLQRGYPEDLINTTLSEVNFKDRKLALQQKPKTNQRILPFVTQYQPSVPNLKQILMKNWHLIEQQPLLSEIYKKPPLVSYKRGRSLKDILVRAKL